jgi:putative tryptophan/tyrosine transport system substrate-binding protein
VAQQPMEKKGTTPYVTHFIAGPNLTIVALLINPNNPESVRQPAELQDGARAIGLQLVVLTATTAGDIDTAFTTMVQNRVGALLVGSDPFFANRREQLIALAAQHAIPTICRCWT